MLLWRSLFRRMDGPQSRIDKHSITFRALLQPQFASERPLLSHMDIAGRQIWRTGIHPLRNLTKLGCSKPAPLPPARPGRTRSREEYPYSQGFITLTAIGSNPP